LKVGEKIPWKKYQRAKMRETKNPILDKAQAAKKGSVSTKIILAQMAAVLVVMAAASMINYAEESRRLSAALHVRQEQILRRLPITLGDPLWNLEDDVISATLDAEMLDRDLQATVVSSPTGTTGWTRDAGGAVRPWKPQDAQHLASRHYRHETAKVVYRHQVIGTIDFYFSEGSIARSLRSLLLQSYVTAVAVVFILSLVTFLLIRSLIGSPLQSVNQALSRVAAGDLGITVPVRSRNEIGALAQSFNAMEGELKRTVESLHRSEERYRGIFENAFEGFFQSTFEGRLLIANPALATIFGYDSPADLIAGVTDTGSQLYETQEERARMIEALRRDGAVSGWQTRARRKDGSVIWVTINSHVASSESGRPCVEGSLYDITERLQSEERMLDLARFPQEDPSPVMRIAPEGKLLYFNPASSILLPSWTMESSGRVPSASLARMLSAWETGEKQLIEVTEGERIFEIVVTPVRNRGYINLYARDVTEERALSERLLQAQKMEGIGRLAGGVAHDFNNLLTVISGYCSLLEVQLSDRTEEREHLSMISRAAERATSLTSNLLAFSRKQVMVPRVVNPGALVKEMEGMLTRLVGEDIEIRTFLRPETGNIKVDSGQIEQVMMNLAANARDAMPTGGKLTIETGNRILDEAYAREHPDVEAGEYVQIAVSDTGQGMEREVLIHVFEPFFTTKAMGKGTGLGLATVYGIVKQSGGHIACYSEPGKGTTFTVYFPRTIEGLEPALPPAASPVAPGRGETILLVEDEESVRLFTQSVLTGKGYVVITASGGREALAAAESLSSEVALLVTDVVMPQMSGKELAQRLIRSRPRLRVLFLSGYTANVIVHHGVLDSGIDFLQKPFQVNELLAKVREILNRP
jgi:two-component system cell cycle sensor histidine kinase/response regulator CckA